MEHWDRDACSGLEALGFTSVMLMAVLAAITILLGLFSLNLI